MDTVPLRRQIAAAYAPRRLLLLPPAEFHMPCRLANVRTGREHPVQAGNALFQYTGIQACFGMVEEEERRPRN